MIIGIDASRAFFKERTGIEEYAYRVIEHLKDQLPKETRVILYVRRGVGDKRQKLTGDLKLPENWKVKEIGWKRFWTQGGLSWEMLRRPVDVLFVPAHTVPWAHPKKTVVVVHGLEYEFCPNAYSFLDRWYMRISIWLSCRWAWRVIAVSKNTRQDLIRLYRISEEKIQVIYEGRPTTHDLRLTTENGERRTENSGRGFSSNFQFLTSKFLLFVGRIEERKNVGRIIEAFEILKEKYDIPHTLILLGKPGYGYNKIRGQIKKTKNKKDIFELGFVSGKEKDEFLSHADILIFPSFYEGFGLPILEAQIAGIPVVTSNISSMPEVAGGGAVLVDPNDSYLIAQGIYSILSDEKKRDEIILLGYQNTQHFSWKRCSREIRQMLING